MISSDRKQFLHDVFVTALEGGIGYWSQASEYHWRKSTDNDCDLDGFYAVVHELTDDESDYRPEGVRITRQTIQRGLALVIDGKANLSDDRRKTIIAANRLNDGGDIDSDLADCIVQAGLFNGEVRYG